MLFWKKTPPEASALDKAITSLYADLDNYHADDKEYAIIVTQLAKLHTLKASEKKPGVSPDTLLVVVGNLFGILMVVAYERTHIVTSKALTFIKSALR
jgi:hypothetical protein